MPLISLRRDHLPPGNILVRSRTVRPPAEAATNVETTALATAVPSPGADIDACDPPLKAKKPKIRIKAPRLTRGMECPTMPGLSPPLRPGRNLPILGPSMMAPTRATTPPERWTTPEPAKS